MLSSFIEKRGVGPGRTGDPLRPRLEGNDTEERTLTWHVLHLYTKGILYVNPYTPVTAPVANGSCVVTREVFQP